MVFYGYLSIVSLVIFLIILSEFVLPKYIEKEYCRKVLHIGTFFALPLANLFYGKGSYHFIVICGVFTTFTIVMYFCKFFKNIDQRAEIHPGIVYYSVSLLIMSILSYIWKDLSDYFAIGYLGMAFGDGFATILGNIINSPKIYRNKTIVGFISCFVITCLSIISFNLINNESINILNICLLSLLASIVELVDYGLDNISVPLSLFLMSYFIDINSTVSICLIVAEIVFLVAFLSKFITYYGSILASLIGFIFYFSSGLNGFLFVIGCYAVLLIISIISKFLKNDISNVVKKTKGKDFIEVFVNGAFASIAMILYGILKNNVLLIISLLTLGECFIDSIASDVGTLSNNKPYDIFHRRYCEKGVSGGMTLLGTLASLFGSIVFAFFITLIADISLWLIPFLTLIMFAGSFVDTMLGSLIQVKYQCDVCGIITEREEHCNQKTRKVYGNTFFNNDTVNLLSNAFVFITSFVLFIFM